MDQSHLKVVETEYGVQYPALYHQLCLEGMLETGKYGGDWYMKYYAERIATPTFLLLSHKFELLEDNSL